MVPTTAALRLARERVDLDKNRLHIPGVATIAKRLLTLCLALALVIGVTAQLMASGIAAPQINVSAGMAGGCDGPQPPCTGHTPSCVDHIGCLTISALPTSLALIAVPVEWTSFHFDVAPGSLAGISVKPELSPPILAA
jgi:hypothetical protein